MVNFWTRPLRDGAVEMFCSVEHQTLRCAGDWQQVLAYLAAFETHTGCTLPRPQLLSQQGRRDACWDENMILLAQRIEGRWPS